MYNVFETKRKRINRTKANKFNMFRAVKHFKTCAVCSKQIDKSFKDSVCLSCNDKISVTHIEHNKIWSVI